MTDQLGRTIDYLRLSVTTACNLRCPYCRPTPLDDAPPALSDDDLVRVVRAAATLGVRHLRLTGGEPLTRPHFLSLVQTLRAIPGLETLSVTTNGTLLAGQATKLAHAGISRINISLDAADEAACDALTGVPGSFRQTLAGIRAAKEAGLLVKLNAVLLPSTDVLALLSLASREQVLLRFIEWMPIGGIPQKAPHTADLMKLLTDANLDPKPVKASLGNGPARYFVTNTGQLFGVIDALSHRFCAGCNRVRVTASGILKPCLCYGNGADLRPYLQDETMLTNVMRNAIFQKPAQHCFDTPGDITEHHSMREIGG